MQIARKFPDRIVVVDKDRIEGCNKLKEMGAKMVILDDAFQYRRLRADRSRDEVLAGVVFRLLLRQLSAREHLQYLLARGFVLALLRLRGLQPQRRDHLIQPRAQRRLSLLPI